MSDNISRQALRDALEKCECKFDGGYDMNEVDAIIADLPSTDRKGHWIQKDYYDTDWNVYECDQCGEPWQLEAGTPKDNNMNFCPNCGADMRGEDE